MIAPKVAVSMDPRLRLPAKPSKLSTQPPIKAPTIPTRAVTTMPPGSGPGMTHFARMPATSPTTIQTTMAPMLMALHLPPTRPRACTGRRLVEYITAGVLRATFADSTPAGATINTAKRIELGVLLREQALHGGPDESQREEEGGTVEQRVHLA